MYAVVELCAGKVGVLDEQGGKAKRCVQRAVRGGLLARPLRYIDYTSRRCEIVCNNLSERFQLKISPATSEY